MADLIRIEQVNDQDVVDSRLIADELGIKHKNILETIKKHQARLERKTQLTYKTETVRNSVGAVNKTIYCYLNEAQTTLLMTMSRNTEKVLDCKEKVTNAFMEAKRIIKEVIPQQSEDIKKLALENANLKLQLELRKTDKYIIEKSESIATMHGVSFLALILGKADSVHEIETKVTETIVCRNGTNVDFVGKSTAELARELGFKSGVQLENWLKHNGLDDLISHGQRAVYAPYIASDNIKEVRKVYYEAKERQRKIGE
jgi:phage regulator Rha-like protein